MSDITERIIKNHDAGGSVPALRMIDLFAGTGAFSLAFESTGCVECVYANDQSVDAERLYTTNFPSHRFDRRNLHDVPTQDIPPHDILTAGFPCQPFSIAGKRQGFEDHRSNVFWKILDIIRHHRPQCIVLENVKNICTHDGGRTFRTIQTSLEDEGYHVDHRVIDTHLATGIPQHRERMYLVGFRHEPHRAFEWSSNPERGFASLSLRSVLQQDVDDKYYYDNGSKIYDMLVREVTMEETVYQYRRTYVRMNKKGLCPTLTANMGTGGHNVPIVKDRKGIRKITPRECFRFQGFPDTYTLPSMISDSRLYQLAGNAVSYPVVKFLAHEIVMTLRR